MRNSRFSDILRRYEWAAVLILLLGGTLLRSLYIAELPMGLNPDEASAGYDAWAILNYGTDRCGNVYPVLLESWGSGQNVLYSLLAMPFIAALGLNVFSLRLVSAVVGALTLLVFWLLARKLRGWGFGLCALFVLVINPWHIMISRWALESNLLPFFLLLGIYLTIVARDKPLALPFAALVFGLSLYAYGTAFVFLPVFLIAACLWLWKWRVLRPVSFTVSVAVFVIAALPIAVCQIRNMLGADSITILGMTLPKLSETRQSGVMSFGSASEALANYKSFLRILVTGSDGLIYNALEGYGLFYIFGLPLAVVGLIVTLGQRRDNPGEMPMLFALAASFIAAFFIQANINRMNMAYLPVIYLSAVGLYWILQRLKGFSFIPVAVMLVFLVMFLGQYDKTFRQEGYGGFYPGLGQAIEYAEEQGAESVHITTYVNQPYIFALFYSQPPPDMFYNTVVYSHPDAAFRPVVSFGRYRFGKAEDAYGEYVILHESEAYGYEIIEAFGEFIVCR